jgi:hypothetical protein
MIEKQISIGMMVVNECIHLVLYSEMFEGVIIPVSKWNIVMQDQIEKANIYSEQF